MFTPSAATAALLAQEFAEDDLTIESLCDQILTRIEIEDAVMQRRTRTTPRRVLRAIWEITRARRRNGLRPHPETVVHSVVWLLAADQ